MIVECENIGEPFQRFCGFPEWSKPLKRFRYCGLITGLKPGENERKREYGRGGNEKAGFGIERNLVRMRENSREYRTRVRMRKLGGD